MLVKLSTYVCIFLHFRLGRERKVCHYANFYWANVYNFVEFEAGAKKMRERDASQPHNLKAKVKDFQRPPPLPSAIPAVTFRRNSVLSHTKYLKSFPRGTCLVGNAVLTSRKFVEARKTINNQSWKKLSKINGSFYRLRICTLLY